MALSFIAIYRSHWYIFRYSRKTNKIHFSSTILLCTCHCNLELKVIDFKTNTKIVTFRPEDPEMIEYNGLIQSNSCLIQYQTSQQYSISLWVISKLITAKLLPKLEVSTVHVSEQFSWSAILSLLYVIFFNMWQAYCILCEKCKIKIVQNTSYWKI